MVSQETLKLMQLAYQAHAMGREEAFEDLLTQLMEQGWRINPVITKHVQTATKDTTHICWVRLHTTDEPRSLLVLPNRYPVYWGMDICSTNDTGARELTISDPLAKFMLPKTLKENNGS